MDITRNVFQVLPGCYLVLQPGPDFLILEVSDGFLKVTDTTRDIIGHPLFMVFPDHPEDHRASGEKSIRAALNQVIKTGQALRMPVHRYDTKNKVTGKFNVKYWSALNVPVMDEEGKLQCIIHSIEDVTDIEIMRQRLRLRDHNTQQQITDAVSTTQEMERMEISRELHDNINQILIAAKWYLGRSLQKDPVEKDLVQSGHDLIEKAMSEIRNLSAALMETSPEEEGLVDGLEKLLGHVISSADINIKKKIRLPDESLIGSKVKTTIFRIVQEQVSNVMKHSEAKNLYLGLEFRDHNLYLAIKDDGKGFHLSENRNGMGFLNMKSRVAIMDGSINIQSSPGDGCAIEVNIPLAKPENDKMNC